MNESKTHYRKAFNSPYLSSADIVEPTTLTVDYSRLEPDKSKKSKDHFNTLYFIEKEIRQGETLKPMILNATNSKMMKEITGSYYLEEWKNVRISVYVQQGIKFGRDTVDGLRIRSAPARQELTPAHLQWKSAVEAYKRDKNFNSILKRIDISEENKKLIIAESATKEVPKDDFS